MEDGNTQYFDLAVLLRKGDLDIRRVIRSNLTMRVGDFFALLSKFEASFHSFLDSMDRIAAQKADESDLENLADIINLLEDIGSTKVITDIDDIIKAGKRGHWAFAADSAEKTQSSYEKLRNRIIAAKKTEGGEAPPAGCEKQSLKSAVAQIESGEAARKLRILAVDDSTVMLNTISSILGGDYKVYGMAKPTMVEKFLQQITPDLILLDYEMPEINGFELIPIIRKFEEHKDTPIIFLTSLGTMEHVSAAAQLGACDFIVKPFQPDNLREKVSKHIVWKD